MRRVERLEIQRFKTLRYLISWLNTRQYTGHCTVAVRRRARKQLLLIEPLRPPLACPRTFWELSFASPDPNL